MSLCLFSCKTIKVPVKEVHTEYVTKKDSFMKYDSIFVHDSVFMHAKNDTVWLERWRTEYRDVWRYRTRVDSFISRDTIPQPFPVPAQLTAWQRLKVDYGGWAIVAVFGAVIYVIIRIREKLPP